MTKEEIQQLLNDVETDLNNSNPSGMLYSTIQNKINELKKALVEAQ